MREFQQRRRLRKIIYSKIVFLLFFAVLVFLMFSTFQIYKKSQEAVFKNNEVKKELKELKSRKEHLDNEAARLRSTSGIEEEIREKFPVALPGEEVLIILDKGNNTEEEPEQEKKASFWQKIFKRD
jgi:cell division protein FtsB